jgi:hypothetical protein
MGTSSSTQVEELAARRETQASDLGLWSCRRSEFNPKYTRPVGSMADRELTMGFTNNSQRGLPPRQRLLAEG